MRVTRPSANRSVWRSGWNRSRHPVGSCSASRRPDWSRTRCCSASTNCIGSKAQTPRSRARRLLAIEEHQARHRSESTLVGRGRELNFLTAVLDEAVGGAGCVVNIVGPPGIGKSRLARETAALAAGRGAAVVTAHCESHTSDVPFRAISRLFRASMGIDDLDVRCGQRRRSVLGSPMPTMKTYFCSRTCWASPTQNSALSDVAADARRRRLTALINAAALAQTEPAVYVIEDVHWIDETSESMLAQLISVIPQTPTLVLITSRPEYHGALTRVSGAQTIGLRPLNAAQGSTLAAELLGDRSIAGGGGRSGLGSCRREPVLRRRDSA